ncbi:hypothetical protein L9F63_000542 [Diploptera punctata]|uniref:Major facilitator superfamily (MFS) profile domain-containing protein n=1 Tax=Diploptera punctata TaxID=6984 RepID=A0AAD8AM95_DIPPU|nr:hypothetical protein L9F63_000542 [Diploptera punctata]
MLSVNRNLLPMKAHYFLFNGGLASILSFLPLYARQLGLSSMVLGTIYTVLPIAGTVAKPMFGALADHFQMQKLVFVTSLVMMTMSYYLMQFIPEAPTHRSVMLTQCDTFQTCSSDMQPCGLNDVLSQHGDNTSLSCQAVCDWPQLSSNTTVVQLMVDIPVQHITYNGSCLQLQMSAAVSECADMNCSMACDSHSVNQLLESPAVVSNHVSQLCLFFVLLILSYLTRVVATSVGDAICFQLLGNTPQEFGQQRLWGAAGWGIAAMLSGVLVDCFSDAGIQKNFTAIFYVMLVLMILDIVVSCKLECKQEECHNIWQNVGKVMSEARVIVFILWCMFVGVATGVLWLFLFWHLEDLVSGDDCQVQMWMKTLEGLVLGVRCFGGELPFFFFSGQILNKIGHVHSMSLVLLVFSLRCILYSLLVNPWWCLPLELLQGLTFGICYSTMASYTSTIAPPGAEATMQGIIGAIFEGVGVSLGSLLGGVLYDTYGGAQTFLAVGVASFIAFLLHVLVQSLLTCSSRFYPAAAATYMSPEGAIKSLETKQTAQRQEK